jgi:3-methylcrotonyl-CoA carboxylase beta subunit
MSDETIIVEPGHHLPGRPAAGEGRHRRVVSAEDLGGGDVHTRVSGVADHLAENDTHALPSPGASSATSTASSRSASTCFAEEPLYDPAELYGVIPTDTRKPYDVREVIARIVDGSRFDEFKARYGTTLVTGFARLYGMPVGIVANNGILFGESAQKGAHFIELCCPARHSAGLPAEHHRLHGRPQVRERRHRQGRRQDGHRRRHRPGAQAHRADRRQLRRRQLRHVRPRLQPRFLWMWPNSRISVMGGEQAASVLATVRRDGIETKGGSWSAEDEEAFKAPIRQQYEDQGHPYYATARLWDDGVVDPAQTRRVLGLSLSASLNAPIQPTKFGLFRM